ncbi:cell division protein FtsA [Thermotoga sp. Ku-13t]|uniref:cell division protein FtsA n=1 Tax=Thermotoga sp. Ku-13t TaxID=1755813 RepID=UPI0013EB1FD7|nr:cell division protein FtsA [Thermotoga sp. Ku-13t]KAF2958728.1 cell division protein FtsA [Thermotoga sp. Ku-13t]
MKSVFALDIGTRKVAGLIGMFEDEVLTVVDYEAIEHPVRSMLDGQIHDIKSVARIIEKVKKNLENRNDTVLEEVAVAVAGRFLKTQIVEATMKIPNRPIDEKILKELEAQALENVNFASDSTSRLYCAGYSVLEYKLDGFWIKNPLGHRGEELYTKLIVAMLPNQVIDAMISALHLAGLRCSFLTLEPMAVFEIALPDELRFLNVALVDIGAGTSDIAIAKAGTVLGYDMVPLAGDEVTEAIARHYLLDFKTAETLKRNIESLQFMEVRNITGETIFVERSEFERVIEPTVTEIAESIAERIEALNLGNPSAVLLVGGGAKLSSLRAKLAERLKLPKERVALRSVEELETVRSIKEGFVGSEYVTLAGIAYMKAKELGSVYDVARLNGEEVRVLRLNKNPTVLQLLTQAGYSLKELIGVVQPPVQYRVNGEEKMVQGFVKKKFRVKLNGRECALHETLKTGDEVVVEPVEVGNVELPRLKDLIKPIRVFFNGNEVFQTLPEVHVNGKKVEDLERVIRDGDDILIAWPKKEEIEQLLKEKLGSVSCTIDGETKRVDRYRLALQKIEEGESEILYYFEGGETRIKDLLPEPGSVTVKFNGRELKIFQKNHIVLVDGEYVSSDRPLWDGMKLQLSKFEPIVADVLASVEIDLKNLKDYTLTLNGKPASFLDRIKDGDELNFVARSKSLDEPKAPSEPAVQ